MKLLVDARIAPVSRTFRERTSNGQRVRHRGTSQIESWHPKCWDRDSRHASFNLDHDGPELGRCSTLIVRDGWWLASILIDLDDADPRCRLVREHVVLGRAVSLLADTFDEDRTKFDRHHADVVQFTSARLQEVCVLHRGDWPWYDGAEIVSVVEVKTKVKPELQAAQKLIRTEAAPDAIPMTGLLTRHFGQVIGVR
jgi:hypothetical protein